VVKRRAELDHAEPELPDASPSPSPNHHPFSHQSSGGIRCVRRFDLGGVIQRIDGGEMEAVVLTLGASLLEIFKNSLFFELERVKGIEPSLLVKWYRVV